MKPLAVVEELDELEDRAARLLAGPKVTVVHELLLERPEEALDGRIAITLAAHARHHPSPSSSTRSCSLIDLIRSGKNISSF